MSTPSGNRRVVNRTGHGGVTVGNTSNRGTHRYSPEEYNEYIRALIEKMREDYERKRKEEEMERRRREDRGTGAIQVSGIEMYAKNNAKAHHTDMYELVDSEKPVPVFRRGQPFYMAIRFNRNLEFQKDRLMLEFSFGPHPQLNKGTLVRLPVHTNKDFLKEKSKWDVRLHSHDGAILTLYVNVPATIPVGVWKLKIISHSGIPSRAETYEYKDNLYFLFNPWVKEDAVYMPDENLLLEYVLNDAGKIFVGTHMQPGSRPWIYGQFKDSVLPATLFVLEKSSLDYPARANPVRVVRAISAMINSQDEGGVIAGRWDGEYEDGKAPHMWTGSSAILEQYFTSGGEPVKYGQCWVFAGVVTTVCRALGIPTRTVTNFVSAHDSDESLTIDKFIDKKGKPLGGGINSDSVWNFHVWNDCWMARPELPPGYGGWQAFDATPQETSEGIYQTGPASLCAIRRGEIGFMFDTPFVFSEVNADVIHWQEDETSETGWKKMSTHKHHVGRFLLTKKAGVEDEGGSMTDMEDITDQYKNIEGTPAERMAILNAARNGGLAYLFDMPSPENEDVSFKLLDIDKIMIGQPFEITVKIQNRSNDVRTIEAVLSASSVYYTGVHARKVKRVQKSFVLQPRQATTHSIQVSADDYMDKLVEYCNMKLFALATVKQTQQTWSEEDDFMVQKPTLKLEVKGELKIGQPFDLSISFTNPLDRVLNGCAFTIEGPGLSQPHTSKFRAIQPRESIVHLEKLTPQKAGMRKIAVVFTARQLVDLTGFKQIEIPA